ncbi:hypothetical protein KY343_06950 [Candidatus Woesearchaeota archaeon]|nr:hypothetical protein [Candidatus Woesearchaeota archaeon]
MLFYILWILLGWWLLVNIISICVLAYAKVGLKSILLLLPMILSFAWLVIPFFMVASFMLNRSLKKYSSGGY